LKDKDLVTYFGSEQMKENMPLEEAIKEGIRKSLGERFRERRDKLEIIADILLAAMKETKKTAIARKVNLNFQRVEKYLSYLEERGLIEYTSNGYKTTEKGKEFLHDYKKMKELFKR